jgi:hypothetical protein
VHSEKEWRVSGKRSLEPCLVTLRNSRTDPEQQQIEDKP